MPDERKLSETDWTRIVWYLSLDVMLPFLGDIGLQTPDQALLRDGFRGLITYLSEPTVKPAPERIFSFSLTYLHGKLDIDSYTVLTRWLRTTYYYVHADNPQISAWQILFVYFRNSWRKTLLTNCPQGAEILTAYKKQVTDERSRIEQAYNNVTRQTLSFWDLEIMAMADLCFNPEDDALFDFIGQNVESDRILQLSASAESWLSAESLAGLRKTGQDLIDQYGIWMPAPLFAFETLRSL